MRPRTKNPMKCPYCGAHVSKFTNLCTGNSYYKCRNNKCVKVIGYIKRNEPYIFIEDINLGFETFLIAKDVKRLSNKSLHYYLKEGSEAFYTDAIANYVLLCSGLLNTELSECTKNINEVRLYGNKFLGLHPHDSFAAKSTDNVKILNISRPGSQRISKKDIISFKFSDKYISEIRSILSKEPNLNQKDALTKVPMSFVLQATKSGNMGHNSFRMLLWLLAIYRIPSPLILHSINSIIGEIGSDLTHGSKAALKRLNKYFYWLYSVGALANVESPINLTREHLNSTIKVNGKFIRLKKPDSYCNLYRTCGAEASEINLIERYIPKEDNLDIKSKINQFKNNLQSLFKTEGTFDDSQFIKF